MHCCRKTEVCSLEGKWKTETKFINVYAIPGHPDKAYLGTPEVYFKNRFYKHISSFKNKIQMNKTTFAKYVWEYTLKYNIILTLRWYIVKSVPSYFNIRKSFILWSHKKFEILDYTNQDELLNKRSEIASKYCYDNKNSLSNYKSNDWHSA